MQKGFILLLSKVSFDFEFERCRPVPAESVAHRGRLGLCRSDKVFGRLGRGGHVCAGCQWEHLLAHGGQVGHAAHLLAHGPGE